MKNYMEQFREKIKQNSLSSKELRIMALEFLDSLESKINCELNGSISMIKHPLSEKTDWYFTYDEMKTIPIKPPEGMQDRDFVKMTMLLSKFEE